MKKNWRGNYNVPFEHLVGKKITYITGCGKGSKVIYFNTEDGCRYKMWHDQDCCETVTVDDVNGDPQRLIGMTILRAEESINSGETNDGNETWTFYRITGRVDKCYWHNHTLVIRWYGESNGYYSEAVDFELLGDKNNAE